MRALLVVSLLISCRGEHRPTGAAQPRQETSAAAQATPQADANDPWAADPWAATPGDDEPDLAERRRIADTACPKVTGPYFYRIEKHGKVSHLLGTRHVGVPLSKFPPPVHRAIDSAKLAVFEVAPNDDGDVPDLDLDLKRELGPQLWKRYETLVGVRTARALERGSPTVAMLALVVMYEDLGATLDAEIEAKVQAAGVPTAGLETSEFQDRLLNKVLDVRMLRATLERTTARAEIAEESRSDLAEYCAGTDTVPGLDDDMRADLLASGYSEAEIARIDEEMVFARNADWIPKLEKILDQDGVFIAVGADHLTGPKGVVALLEKRGYKLTRITR